MKSLAIISLQMSEPQRKGKKGIDGKNESKSEKETQTLEQARGDVDCDMLVNALNLTQFFSTEW